jgi:hypothetical protein
MTFTFAKPPRFGKRESCGQCYSDTPPKNKPAQSLPNLQGFGKRESRGRFTKTIHHK